MAAVGDIRYDPSHIKGMHLGSGRANFFAFLADASVDAPASTKSLASKLIGELISDITTALAPDSKRASRILDATITKIQNLLDRKWTSDDLLELLNHFLSKTHSNSIIAYINQDKHQDFSLPGIQKLAAATRALIEIINALAAFQGYFNTYHIALTAAEQTQLVKTILGRLLCFNLEAQSSIKQASAFFSLKPIDPFDAGKLGKTAIYFAQLLIKDIIISIDTPPALSYLFSAPTGTPVSYGGGGGGRGGGGSSDSVASAVTRSAYTLQTLKKDLQTLCSHTSTKTSIDRVVDSSTFIEFINAALQGTETIAISSVAELQILQLASLGLQPFCRIEMGVHMYHAIIENAELYHPASANTSLFARAPNNTTTQVLASFKKSLDKYLVGKKPKTSWAVNDPELVKYTAALLALIDLTTIVGYLVQQSEFPEQDQALLALQIIQRLHIHATTTDSGTLPEMALRFGGALITRAQKASLVLVTDTPCLTTNLATLNERYPRAPNVRDTVLDTARAARVDAALAVYMGSPPVSSAVVSRQDETGATVCDL